MKNQAPEVDVLESIVATAQQWLRINLPQEWAEAWLPEAE